MKKNILMFILLAILIICSVKLSFGLPEEVEVNIIESHKDIFTRSVKGRLDYNESEIKIYRELSFYIVNDSSYSGEAVLVVLTVENKLDSPIKGVEVTESVPHIVTSNIIKDIIFSEKPKEIKDNKITWSLGDLGPKGQRNIRYVIRKEVENDLLLYYTPPEVNSDFYARGGKFYYNPYFIIGVILVIILLDLFIFIIPAYIRTKGNRGGKFFKTVIRSSQHKKEIEEKSKLRDYIAKYLGQGYNIQQIRQSLINQGYNPNEIDKTISESNSIK